MKDFEKNMKRLEEIVDLLNNNQATLKDGLDLLEEGIALIKTSNSQLEQGKGKLQKLLKDEGVIKGTGKVLDLKEEDDLNEF